MIKSKFMSMVFLFTYKYTLTQKKKNRTKTQCISTSPFELIYYHNLFNHFFVQTKLLSMANLISKSTKFNHFLQNTRVCFLRSFTTSAAGAGAGGYIKPAGSFSGESAAIFRPERYQSGKAGEQLDTIDYEEDENQVKFFNIYFW